MDTKKLWTKIDPRKWVELASPVTLIFAGLSLLVLIINWISGGGANKLLFSVYRSSFSDFFAYPRMFLHVLGHSSFAHYAGNMALLLVLGPLVEKQYGTGKLVLMMLVTALFTGLFHLLFSPQAAALGASGIVFMMILLSAATGSASKKVPLTLILVALIYLGQEVAGFFIKDNVSQLAHIIGGLCGMAFGLFFKRPKKA